VICNKIVINRCHWGSRETQSTKHNGKVLSIRNLTIVTSIRFSCCKVVWIARTLVVCHRYHLVVWLSRVVSLNRRLINSLTNFLRSRIEHVQSQEANKSRTMFCDLHACALGIETSALSTVIPPPTRKDFIVLALAISFLCLLVFSVQNWLSSRISSRAETTPFDAVCPCFYSNREMAVSWMIQLMISSILAFIQNKSKHPLRFADFQESEYYSPIRPCLQL
jgi:hypothetical protein